MALNQHTSNLVDITVKAFNGNVASVSPIDGISLIDSWISALNADDQSDSSVTSGLSDLKTQLQSGNPDGSQIHSILDDLVSQVKQTAGSADTDVKTKLTSLIEALQGFNQQLAGSTPRDNSDRQAPMTSTVGGESTNSGAGASSFDASDDSLSNRNGGTISNGPADDMDDQTGSDGGTAETNDSSESEGDNLAPRKGSNESRSDTARVDGPGISGGTGDADSSQSGGRSQY